MYGSNPVVATAVSFAAMSSSLLINEAIKATTTSGNSFPIGSFSNLPMDPSSL